ncbi:MAG: CinA family nicotinamide mononucleotide deamidase-related protein [Blastochloris sp.]|nr:CinA family nicotinamide mononucleotide deamidase-related protein [Blastochloris sp.]
MNAEIIAIGSELLLGETIDTNSAYLAQQLTAYGINVFRKSVVGDNEERIATAIAEVLDRADLVICTGGLGPTVDDVTREAVARAFGRSLEFHQYLLDQIEARFRAFGRTMSDTNRRQAYAPQGARIVENPKGTAPSFIVEDTRGTVVVLPGVPREMRYLWEHAIAPYLRNERGETSVILIRTLHAAGRGESVIGEIIADLMAQHNPTVGISAKQARYELRIGAKATSREAAEAMIDQVEATIRERLGDSLVGEEQINQAVLHLLQEHNLTLALHEGTNRAPVYRTLATVDNSTPLHGIEIHTPTISLDDNTVQEAAQVCATNVRERYNAAIGLGVQIATSSGADGFTTVAVAVVHGDNVRVWTQRFDLSLAEGWEFIGTLALDSLRKYILEVHPKG